MITRLLSIALVTSLALVGGSVSAVAASLPALVQTGAVAADQYRLAQVEAQTQREAALETASALREWRTRASRVLEEAAAVQSIPGGVLDEDARAAVAALVDALTAAQPSAVPIVAAIPPSSGSIWPGDIEAAAARLSGWRARLAADWAAHATEVDDLTAATRALETALMALAGTVPAAGAAALDAAPLASDATRAAVSDAIDHIERCLDEGLSPATALAEYSAAVIALRASQKKAKAAADAKAAEAAARAGGSGGGGGLNGAISFGGTVPGSYEEAYYMCHEGHPWWGTPSYEFAFPCSHQYGNPDDGWGKLYTFYE